MDEKEDTTIYKVVVNHEEDGRGRTQGVAPGSEKKRSGSLATRASYIEDRHE